MSENAMNKRDNQDDTLQQEQEYMEQLAGAGLDSLEPPESSQSNNSMELYNAKKEKDEAEAQDRLNKEAQELEQENKQQNEQDIQEGFIPENLNYLHLPKELESGVSEDNAEIVKEFNQEWTKKTPSWLDVHVEPKGNYYKLIKEVDANALGIKLAEVQNFRIYHKLPNGMRYNRKDGSWYVYGAIKARDELSSMISKALIAWGTKLKTNNKRLDAVQEALDHMRDTELEENPFETSKPYLVSFKNGTYNMKTGELNPKHNPDDFILNGHSYNLELSTETPETDKYLDVMLGDAKQFFMEYLGYGFYRSYQPYQKIVFLNGEGGNGKSWLLNNVVQPLYGKRNFTSVAPDELSGDGSRFAPASLYKQEMNIVADINKSHLSNPATLKKLVGGDVMRAEYKGQNSFEFTNYAKMIFSANHLPTFSESGRALRDRLTVIKMAQDRDTRDDLTFWNQFDQDKIRDERNRFAYKCMLAFKSAYFDNPEHKFSESTAMKQDSKEWFRENDHFAEWLDECEIKITKVTPENESSLGGEKTTYVQKQVKAFYEQNGYKGIPSTVKITEELKRRGVIKKKSRNGINLNSKNPVSRYVGLKIGFDILQSAYNDNEEQNRQAINEGLERK